MAQVRREKRFCTKNTSAKGALLGEFKGSATPFRLVNLSSRGVCIEVPRNFPVSDRLYFTCEADEAPSLFSGIVQWSKETSDGNFQLGLSVASTVLWDELFHFVQDENDLYFS
ncbi:PilZ domain-containing protein [Pseudobacteriovorax antillogorgiicola]|uniref:PilZ domain-containing protein n=1 Tax=Pseudobacteriovorax antillogorgiicola TaxID=1513793 RepID=A0A1Y6CSH6_9BACT|nr:PilZ domain-containing protein [Pseudobacteriovorax antillogorgiicola]TCS46198.1 PilZ domain-containing protein [Pseudobacteriovorax antillogorgiicola]SMF70181.1 PilZ domain-containing protein [Pseudobacteriovorax antillogorgiicola]